MHTRINHKQWQLAILSVVPFSTVSSSSQGSKAASHFPRISLRAPKENPKTNEQHQTVPGSSQRFLDKSRSLTADCVTYDLEDSVTPHMKVAARSLVRRAIDQAEPAGIRERAVRINSVDSGLALGDLTEVVSGLQTIDNRHQTSDINSPYNDQLANRPSCNHQT